MSAYKFPFIGWPFKGQWYYEWQVGPVVLQLSHKLRNHRGPRLIPLLYAWWDTAWKQTVALGGMRR